MSRSPLLDSFDPFATHPFTNNSGLTPRPPLPSLYPSLIPSLHSQPTLSNTYPDLSSSSTQTINSMSSTPNMTTVHSFTQQSAPLPNSPQATGTSRSPPVFIPYRRDTSSPDLVLKQKRLPHTAAQHTK